MHRHADRIRTVQHDVREASAASTAKRTAVDALDRIDVAVHTARSAETTVEDFNVDSFTVPIETNLSGFVYLKPMQVKHCPDWKPSGEIERPDAKIATVASTPL